jgi:glycosyltransferase involved in cell wall biosynthesis
MSKKILYVVPAFPVGGAEKFLIMLTRSMVKENVRQTIVSLSTDNKLKNELDRTIHFIPIPRKNKFDVHAIKTLRNLIKQERPDKIMTLNFFSFFFSHLAMIGSSSKPSIFISYQTTIHINKKEHWLHKLYTSVLTKRDHILFTSKNQELYTVKEYHIQQRFYSTIINGIDLTRWHLPDNKQTGMETRKKYGIPADGYVIILTAGFRKEKNHEGAIRSLKILHTKYASRAYLLLVGGGSLFDHCRQYAEEMGMKEYIRFAGPQEDVRPFYWAANLFTLCSTAVETFSFAALEAMACGLPCVLTEIGGANEMIKEGLNGYLCKPLDQDIALGWSKALNNHFSAQVIHDFTKEHFSADRMTNEYKHFLLSKASN